MSVIDRVTAQYASLERQHIDVPEWGEPERPLRIFFKPMTVYDKRRIFKGGRVEDQQVAVDTLIYKARDEQDKPLFTIDDRQKLLHESDARIIERVAAAILKGETAEEAEKN